MEQDHVIASHFRALSHHNRAKLFRILVDTPEAGQSYSDLKAVASMTDATLTHHLREMERAGLIKRRRRGIHTTYFVDAKAFITALSTTQTRAQKSRFHKAVA